MRHFSRTVRIVLGMSFAITACTTAMGGGITADVGLTPPLDRWIFRTQVRYVERDDDPTGMGREMQMYAVPVVLAYGLRPNVTVIARQIAFHRRMDMPLVDAEVTGLGDFMLMTKWRALRVNRRDYILGIAPVLGVEAPTGDDDFGSDTWDALTGAFLTARRGPLGADLNVEYVLNAIDDRGGGATRPGDALTANLALSYQFTLDRDATLSLWPVLELTYTDVESDRRNGGGVADSGGHLLTAAPGVKFARQSFMLEALVQLPVSEDLNGNQLDRGIGMLAGLRYLF